MNTELDMNTEFQVDAKRMVKNITINDIFGVFIKKILFILLIPVILSGSLYALDYYRYTPKYSSTATLYILRQANNTVTASDVASDFSLALKVVNDCTYMLKGHTVLDKVQEQLNLNMEHDDLYKSISTYNPENTRILEVTVEAESPELAREIVDNLCSIGVSCINDVMGFEQINLYEWGTLEAEPCNKPGIKKYFFIGAAVAVVIFLVFLVLFLLDDTITDDEEIQRYLGLSILGDIPNSETPTKKRYGYKYYRRNKYYGKKYGEEK